MKIVMPRHAVFFDVSFDAGWEENRIEMRAVVTALGGPDTRNLRTTVETFDAETGRNTIFIGNPDI
jgi:hypothetical protein